MIKFPKISGKKTTGLVGTTRKGIQPIDPVQKQSNNLLPVTCILTKEGENKRKGKEQFYI